MARHDASDLIRRSPQFDAAWYMARYPDVGMAKMDPAEHYLRYGRLLRRDPGPDFSTAFALDTIPDLAKSDENPLVFLARKPDAAVDRRGVLAAAGRVLAEGKTELGLRLAAEHLDPAHGGTLHLLGANAALQRGDRDGWLDQLNRYLGQYRIAPIQLQKGATLVERLSTAALPQVTGGPKISVIMPAFNAEATVRAAAQSILRQTWRNLELLIVDDASADGTWAVLQDIAAADKRVRIMRNKVNVGPYVSKNIALSLATGGWVTGQDADDWSHPQRLENHIGHVRETGKTLKGSVTHMVRIRPDGFVSHFGRVTKFCPDGACRVASISCLYERDFLTKRLGFWDDVRFSADSEMIARFERVAGTPAQPLPQIGMICLDLETSLTNHSEFGVGKTTGLSPIRADYRQSWVDWHKTLPSGKAAPLSFPHEPRQFEAPEAMRVSAADIRTNLAAAMAMED